MIRIATVYNKKLSPNIHPNAMDTIRWQQVSMALAKMGYKVDIVTGAKDQEINFSENLRYISVDRACWRDYDVVKTLFHSGYELLFENGGDEHPFIISKLGSVVGSEDKDGVYFYGDARRNLFTLQEYIAQQSRYVTILTNQSKELWIQEHRCEEKVLMIPTGVEKEIPKPGDNPYLAFKEKIVVYIGNIYKGRTQREVNMLWQQRLNMLGKMLKKRSIRLCLIGKGEVDQLEKDAVTYLGEIDSHKIWDYQYYADVAIVLAQGGIQDNESSKIYYYLRSGLPVVSEDPIPNNHIIKKAKLGFIVEHRDHQAMVDKIDQAIHTKWDKQKAIKYMLKHHTWDQRVKKYDGIFREEFCNDRSNSHIEKIQLQRSG